MLKVLSMAHWLCQKKRRKKQYAKRMIVNCGLFLLSKQPNNGRINAEPAILQYNIHKYENAIISNGWYNKHVIIFISSVYFFPSPSFYFVCCAWSINHFTIFAACSFFIREKFKIWNVPHMCYVCVLCLFIIVISS